MGVWWWLPDYSARAEIYHRILTAVDATPRDRPSHSPAHALKHRQQVAVTIKTEWCWLGEGLEVVPLAGLVPKRFAAVQF